MLHRVGREKEKGGEGKILLTTNPSVGWLYDDFYKPWRENRPLKEGYIYIPANTATNPHILWDTIKTMYNSDDKALMRRNLLGDWDYADNEDSLVDYQQVLALFQNVSPLSDNWYMSVDIGGTGSKADSTIMTV